MADWDDVREIALQLPEAEELPLHGQRSWRVRGKLFASEPEIFFTTPHFDGNPTVLVRLDRIGVAELEEVIVEAWLARAPKRLADAYVRARAGERLGLDAGGGGRD